MDMNTSNNITSGHKVNNIIDMGILGIIISHSTGLMSENMLLICFRTELERRYEKERDRRVEEKEMITALDQAYSVKNKDNVLWKGSGYDLASLN